MIRCPITIFVKVVSDVSYTAALLTQMNHYLKMQLKFCWFSIKIVSSKSSDNSGPGCCCPASGNSTKKVNENQLVVDNRN